MPSYPAGMTVSNRSLIMLADALRQRRTTLGTKSRRLPAGRQALLVVAHLGKGETYTDLARGFQVGTTKAYRYLREGIDNTIRTFSSAGNTGGLAMTIRLLGGQHPQETGPARNLDARH